MSKETSKKIWSLWGAGLGLSGAIGEQIIYGTNASLEETIGYVIGGALGGWITAILSYTAHFYLYARKGLDPNQRPFVRISRSVMLVWLLFLTLIFSLSILASIF